jgi:hypothetical protein
MDRECSIYKKETKYTQNFDKEQKKKGKAWNGFRWFWMGASGDLQ